MEYVTINDESKIACQLNGRQYTYSFIDGDDEFAKIHHKSPLEHSTKTDVGKELYEIISREPISATSDYEREKIYKRRFDKILQNLQDLIDKSSIEEEEKSRKSEEELIESYQIYYERFENNREMLGYTPLQYLVRIFESYGVNSTLEIFKAYLGYLQTLTGLKGTNVIAIGGQSSGKSHLIENPLDCIPDQYVHRGVYTKASFFTEFAGQDLTHHIFYMGDLGGVNDDMTTIEFRDTIKPLSTDGYISRNYKEDGEVIEETITGYPALVYTTTNEEMINDQEKSRSIILMPPDVDRWLLMIYDSFNEAPASDFELKIEIEQSKNLVKGFTWYIMNNFMNIEMFNPYMFAVQQYLDNIDDFNRKIKEFNVLLKLVIVLNGGFQLNHDMYYDEREEPIDTTVVIASKKDVIDALNLFEGSSGLLPTEVALIKGLLKNYVCYNEVENVEIDDDESFEEAVINYNKVDEDDEPVDLKVIKTVTDKGDKYHIENWDHAYQYWNPETDAYEDKYVWFTVPKIKSVFNTQRWYRNIKDKLSEKLLKLHEFGMLIKVGKTESGANIYGINYGIDEYINNIEPNWNKSAINEGVKEFHRKYPSLIDEFDDFVSKDRKLNIKYTDMEIKDNGLYDLPWRR